MIRIRRKRSFVIKLLVLAGFFFMIGFYYHYHLPRIKQWLLVEAEALSKKHSPISLWPQDVELNLIPIGITFKDIRLQPKNELKSQLVIKHLDELQISLSFWDLLKGKLGIGLIRLQGADAKVFFKSGGKRLNGIPFNFTDLDFIPIHKVQFENISLWAKATEDTVSFHTPNLEFAIEKKQRSIRLSAQATDFKIKRSENPAIFKSNLDIRLQVDKDEITVTRLKVQKEDSFLLASGWLEWAPKTLKIDRIVGRARTSLYMPDVELLLAELKLVEKTPSLKGHLNLEVNTDHIIGAQQEGDFEIETSDLNINGFEVGSVEAIGKGNRDEFSFDKFKITHSGGTAIIQNLKTQLKSPYIMSGQVTGENIDINPLLDGIKIENVPVFTSLNPRLNCTAKFQPSPLVNCDGNIQFQKLDVKSGMESETSIVKIKNGNATGQVTIDKNKVTYSSKILLENSSGSSNGVIDYKKGFKINYEAEKLDLLDIAEISGIPLEGMGTLTGSTSGNSKAAILDMNINSTDFYIDNFGLGSFKSKVRYRKGLLYFSGINGSHRSTQYKGNVTLNLRKKNLYIDASLPFLDIENIQELLARKLKINTDITGTGNARIIVKGPFDLNRLSYDVNAQVFRGVIANESYDQLQIKLKSESGLVTAEEISLTKGSGVMKVRGQGKMGNDINAQIIARGFRIEQSENLSQRDIKLGGLLDFNSQITGSFSNPLIKGEGQLRSVLLGDIPVAGARFKIQVKDKVFSGNAQFGEKIASFNWKLGMQEDGIVDLNGEFNNWDFSQAFSMFSDNLRTNSYSANLKGKFSFNGNKSDLSRSTANINLQEVKLKTDKSELSNTKPMILNLQNGVIKTENFRLSGSGGYARLQSDQKKSGSIDLKLDGRAEMSLLSLLTPFLEDIRGQLNVGLALTGSLTKPVLSGNMYIADAYVRAKSFPHGLENGSADILFDRNKIIINNVKGRLAGGSATANGQIVFNGVRDLSVDINGQFFDSNFLVPTGFNTRGNGSVSVQGNWFPYKLAVNYNVASGSIDREIKVESSDKKEIKPSAYLPKFLAEKRFAPITLDIQVSLPNKMSTKLRVTRLDVDAKISGNIRVMGPPEEPLLTGRIQVLQGGLITFRDNVFEVQNGFVEYANERPENPKLNISAQSQVRAKIDADGEEKDFDVSLRVLGTAAEPIVTVSSQPALSESELLSLLTLGFISDAGGDVTDSTSSDSDITNTSYQLGSAFLNEQLGLNREIGKRLGVKFDFSSAFNADDNAAVHTFTVKKQWTPKFGTSASRSVGKTSTNKIEAKYRINNNVSVIGNYEGKEQTGASSNEDPDEEENLFGLDIEYKVDFK